MSKSIYTHIHHIIPTHAGGSDDPSNLIELTTEEHAIAHQKLFFIYGRRADYVAWKALSKQIGKEEAHRMMTVHYGKDNGNYGMGHKQIGELNPMWGKKHKPETLKALSEMNTGENNSNFGGIHHTPEVRKKMSDIKKGSKNNQWGKHWYTNGIENKSCFEGEQPEGFTRGRIAV